MPVAGGTIPAPDAHWEGLGSPNAEFLPGVPFALGVMNAVWLAVVAVLIALEKTLPWRRTATYSTAIVLLALGVLVLAVPEILPGLTVPEADPMPMTAPG